MMLVVASLLGRSFFSALHVDRGYDPSRVTTAALTMSGSGYSPARRIEVLESVVSRLAASPGVEAAAFASEQPFTPGGSTSAMQIAPAGGGTPVLVQASPRQVSPAYFEALGLRIVTGRGLSETDSTASEPVAVVNETLARKYFPGGAIGALSPMGICGGGAQGTATIVGVVEDVRYVGATVTSLPELYFSNRQLPVGLRSSTATLLIRNGGDAATLAGSLRNIVRDADASATLGTVMTIEDRLLATSLARPRLYAMLLAAFAAVALVVTGVGLFGTLSYAMAQRGRELALRSALGASRVALLRTVLSQGMGAVVVGLAIGLAGARGVAGLASTVLFGVTPNDTLTYLSVPLMMIVVALIACAGPARRAWRIDPIGALRRR
jgi:predicted permease